MLPLASATKSEWRYISLDRNPGNNILKDLIFQPPPLLILVNYFQLNVFSSINECTLISLLDVESAFFAWCDSSVVMLCYWFKVACTFFLQGWNFILMPSCSVFRFVLADIKHLLIIWIVLYIIHNTDILLISIFSALSISSLFPFLYFMVSKDVILHADD